VKINILALVSFVYSVMLINVKLEVFSVAPPRVGTGMEI